MSDRRPGGDAAAAPTPPDYLRLILNARVYDVAVETPLELAPALSRRIDNKVYFKREDMQSVFSFKLRGAYNKMANLPESQLKRGVICASAGNHAQGVAMSAARLPREAPFDLIFADPPYGVGSGSAAAKAVASAAWLAPGGLLAIETARGDTVDVPAGYEVEATRVVGRASLTLLRG